MREVPPTKTNLLRLKQELEFAELGYDLLDRKRNILIGELLNLVDQTVIQEEQMENILADAFSSLQNAVLKMGKLKVTQLSRAIHIDAEINMKMRKIMGVRLPVVETSFNEFPPFFSPMGTNFWIDDSLKAFKEALKQMGRLAEQKISITRLANEVRKTIRKVNALEKIAIPDLKETVGHIANRLEENERDMFVLMKMIKSKLEGKVMKKEA